MNKNRFFNKYWLLPFLILSCTTPSSNVVRIAAASNMQFVLDELTDQFEKKENIKTELIIASSGKLTSQILEGAPFDIFLSADLNYPQTIYDAKKGLSIPKVYAYGQLVLWSGKKRDNLNLDKLLTPDIEHIAIANPAHAPYGQAAKECLDHHELSNQLSEKIVYGESISQVNQFVSTGAVEFGFTAKSVVLANDQKGSWINIDTSEYSPIKQGIIMIDRGKGVDLNTQKFHNFLFDVEGQRILKEFGYLGNIE